MTVRTKIVDQGRLLSPRLAAHIAERAQKLEHFFEGVEACRVRVDGPGQHPLHGRIRVRIYVSVPGTEIAINRQTGQDLPMAIRESFDAADQRLEDYVRRRHRNSKRAKRRPAGGPSRGSG
jgi:ribosome-associated translation inhibitor RaiA